MTSAPQHQSSSEAAKPDRWEVIYVLPNLSPAKDRWNLNGETRPSDLLKTGMTLGSSNLAIVPVHDPRVQAAMADDPNVARLVDVFVDERGKKLHPALLIAREVRTTTLTQEALVAFRNSIALSVILRNRAWWAKGNDNAHMGWSDYFDFHPLRAGTHGLVSDSPALTSIITERAKHQAMPSPYVSATTMTALWADGFLYYTLGVEWRRFFEAPQEKTTYGEGLFRSLEIAYVASATPVKHGGSIYEWGVQVALWVSAIEVLVSVLNGEASQLLSLDLLAEYEWGDYRPELGAKDREITFGRGSSKTVRQLNIVQHACHLLYRTRHKFLHGNKVDNGDLYPWGRQLGPTGEPPISIIALAPVIYRIGLHAFLSRNHKPNFNESGDSNDIDPLLLASVLVENDYADALKTAYKIPDRSEAEIGESEIDLEEVDALEADEVSEPAESTQPSEGPTE
jgi:hypothetical protein